MCVVEKQPHDGLGDDGVEHATVAMSLLDDPEQPMKSRPVAPGVRPRVPPRAVPDCRASAEPRSEDPPTVRRDQQRDAVECGLDPAHTSLNAVTVAVREREHGLARQPSCRERPPRRTDIHESGRWISVSEECSRDRVPPDFLVGEIWESLPRVALGTAQKPVPAQAVERGRI